MRRMPNLLRTTLVICGGALLSVPLMYALDGIVDGIASAIAVKKAA